MKPRMRGRRIGVLMGGLSSERDQSLRTGEAVHAALVERGYDAVKVFVDSDLDLVLRAERVDVAFLALHGRYGEDGCVQGLLELFGIPYTGSSVLSSALAMDKLKAKELFRLHNLSTPPYYVHVRGEGAPGEQHGSFGFPSVVKPRAEGSSLGVRRVDEVDELENAVEEALRFDDHVLVERFVEGAEVHVAVLGGRPLGAVEVDRAGRLFDYAARHQAAMPLYVPPRLVARAAARRADAGDARGARARVHGAVRGRHRRLRARQRARARGRHAAVAGAARAGAQDRARRRLLLRGAGRGGVVARRGCTRRGVRRGRGARGSTSAATAGRTGARSRRSRTRGCPHGWTEPGRARRRDREERRRRLLVATDGGATTRARPAAGLATGTHAGQPLAMRLGARLGLVVAGDGERRGVGRVAVAVPASVAAAGAARGAGARARRRRSGGLGRRCAADLAGAARGAGRRDRRVGGGAHRRRRRSVGGARRRAPHLRACAPTA